jgi:hypothetical protein
LISPIVIRLLELGLPRHFIKRHSGEVLIVRDIELIPEAKAESPGIDSCLIEQTNGPADQVFFIGGKDSDEHREFMFRLPINAHLKRFLDIPVGGLNRLIEFIKRHTLIRKTDADEGFDFPTEGAVEHTVITSGRQILFTAATLGVGFFALTFADFVPVATLGWLMVLTVVLVGLATLTLLPAAVLVAFRDPGGRAAPASKGEPV